MLILRKVSFCFHPGFKVSGFVVTCYHQDTARRSGSLACGPGRNKQVYKQEDHRDTIKSRYLLGVNPTFIRPHPFLIGQYHSTEASVSLSLSLSLSIWWTFVILRLVVTGWAWEMEEHHPEKYRDNQTVGKSFTTQAGTGLILKTSPNITNM